MKALGQVLVLVLLVAASLEAQQRHVIAGAAHAGGVNGTVWRTDVWLFNPTNEDLEVPFRFLPTGLDGCTSSTPPAVTVEAGQTAVFEGALGGSGVRQGLIEVWLPSGVLARARTYNQTDAGDLGQRVPVVPESSFAPAGSTAVLTGLQRSDRFRTNLFLLFGSSACGSGGSAEVTAFDRSGAQLAAATFVGPARGQSFTQDVFEALGVGDCDRCHLRVVGDADVFVFASVIDNLTGDPTIVSSDTPGVRPAVQGTAAGQ